MIGEARGLFYEAPWLSLLPGLLILATVGACNLLAEALAARLDQRPASWSRSPDR
jgi:ABC-type dipeptide/oligopeptide/nickel transport system permease subunit